MNKRHKTNNQGQYYLNDGTNICHHKWVKKKGATKIKVFYECKKCGDRTVNPSINVNIDFEDKYFWLFITVLFLCFTLLALLFIDKSLIAP